MPHTCFMKRHLPLITTNLSFCPEPLPTHPPTTTDQEFIPCQTFDPNALESYAVDRPFIRLNEASFEETSDTPVVDDAAEACMDLDDDGKSAMDSDEESSDEGQDQEMIEKPKGEVSRQYKLADELQKSGWTAERVAKLRNYVHTRADVHLDTSVSYASQKRNVVNLVCAEAQIKFGELENYRNSWPVIDILKSRLKCTSERARKQVTNVLADKGRARGKIAKRKDKGKECAEVDRA